jgi:hypothetical protein
MIDRYNTLISVFVYVIETYFLQQIKTPHMTRIGLLMILFLFNCSFLKAQQVSDSSGLPVGVDSLKVDSSAVDVLHKAVDAAPIADATSATKKRSYLMAGLSYMNDNVYLGRKDSVVLPYLTFDLGYYFKSGFFIDGAVNYLASSSQSRIDAVSISGGYSFTSKNYSGEASASKYFYSSQSTNIKSTVKSSVSYFNSYDFGFITPTLTAFLDFGKKTDVGGIFGLEHTFYALDDKLDFTPTFNVNVSTLNFYNNYYKTKRYTTTRKNKAPVTGVAKITGIVQNASTLKVLDYELSLPVEYQLGKFALNVNPVYAFPLNPSVVQVTTTKANNTSTSKLVTEKIENTFFITVGVTYKFGKKL